MSMSVARLAFGSALALVLAFLGCVQGRAEESTPRIVDVDASAESLEGVGDEIDDEAILDLDLEDLGKVAVVVESFDMEVTSVTRNESTVGRSPAAVFVITNEMLRRTGASSLPEALRYVPGMTVARLDANKWAVSSRGFNGEYANKLLVLLDGRSLYSPTFAGVVWSHHDIVMQDVERIEVIRGPGASVWGANAVNGVINVITKDAADTQGIMASAGGGTEDRNITTARYGSKIGDVSYRLYGKRTERDSGYSADSIAADDWRAGRVGFRSDWSSCEEDCDHVTAEGELYSGTLGQYAERTPIGTAPYTDAFPVDDSISGGFGLVRWKRRLEDDSSVSLQSYYDQRRAMPVFQDSRLDIFDLEFQHQLAPIDEHRVTWGLGYRSTWTDIESVNEVAASFSPSSVQTILFSGFVQDQYSIYEDWDLTAGCKFEQNDYTGLEFQPTLRLLHTINDRQVVWAAASRAVRTPSQYESFGKILVPAERFPIRTLVRGSQSLQAEDVFTLELGYRAQPSDRFSWDLAGFYNHYSDLIGLQLSGYPAGVPLTAPAEFSNIGTADSTGLELFAKWQTTQSWQLSSGASFLYTDLDGLDRGGVGFLAPRFQAYATSFWNLTPDIEFDASMRYVDNHTEVAAPAYVSMDARVGIHLTDGCEFSIAGQNLLDSHRQEAVYSTLYSNRTEVQRALYAQLTWRR
ncbi:Colicin I receptor precursor [Rubripirellula lacrimiformis]|uniref:Colicin I receptor n=1 Tax=Rubripirellula lacrimiformis TaxID=1930273 RepID=A0A517NCV3_9BACT|nr:TonB-dependent receptor [Rubripirellula lacrimiformis]QDT04965.1 Colicin I receptor precursor [Rubripirellula lacrimiformis]